MKRLALLLCCLVLGLGSAWASTGSINPNDFQDPVNWCTNYGCTNGQFGTPQNWISTGGLTGMVGLVSSQNMQNLQQGNSWFGNYSNGMGLIYNGVFTLGNTPGGILLSFNTPVNGAGAYIQANFQTAFTGSIQLYDASFNLLGGYSHAGGSDSNVGTALFLGAFDSTVDVSYALFDTSQASFNEDFSIGTLIIQTTGQSTTPEPSTLLLVGPSLLGLAGVLRRRMSRKEVL